MNYKTIGTFRAKKMFGNMEKIAAFIIWFIIWGGITIAILYLIEFGFTNPLYIDWKSHLSFLFSLPFLD